MGKWKERIEEERPATTGVTRRFTSWDLWKMKFGLTAYRFFMFDWPEARRTWERFDLWLNYERNENGRFEWSMSRQLSGLAREIRLGLIYSAIAFIAAMLIVWQLYLAFWQPGNPVQNPGPHIPAVVQPPAFEPQEDPFDKYSYISARDSEALRSRTNVINVAVIGAGHGVRYMTDRAVSLDRAIWEEVRQIDGVTGFTLVGGSSFDIEVGNQIASLNQDQGFILADWPGWIYIVVDGHILRAKFDEGLLLPLEEAISRLPETVPANENLSLTYR